MLHSEDKKIILCGLMGSVDIEETNGDCIEFFTTRRLPTWSTVKQSLESEGNIEEVFFMTSLFRRVIVYLSSVPSGIKSLCRILRA